MNLQIAIQIARRYHRNQVDKAGKPYLNHVLAVSNMGKTEDEKIVGALHDVIEDTNCSLLVLTRYGFSDRAIDAVDAISRRENESYNAYIRRLMDDKLAIQVKIYDSTHNSDITRIKNPKKPDYDRVKRYRKNIKKLEKALKDFED